MGAGWELLVKWYVVAINLLLFFREVANTILSVGGVTNGNDLLAAYARSGKHWPLPIVEAGLALTEVGDRGQFYDKEAAA